MAFWQVEKHILNLCTQIDDAIYQANLNNFHMPLMNFLSFKGLDRIIWSGQKCIMYIYPKDLF
jgi:hypothetical protein